MKSTSYLYKPLINHTTGKCVPPFTMGIGYIKELSTLLSTNTYSFFASLVKTSKARISIEACVLNNLLNQKELRKLSHDARVICTRLLYELVIAYMPKFPSAMYCLYKSYTIEHPFKSLFLDISPKIKQEYTDNENLLLLLFNYLCFINNNNNKNLLGGQITWRNLEYQYPFQ